jgi:hypothetical protein
MPVSLLPCAVGDQIPADLRVVELMSSVLRTDQVWERSGNKPPLPDSPVWKAHLPLGHVFTQSLLLHLAATLLQAETRCYMQRATCNVMSAVM